MEERSSSSRAIALIVLALLLLGATPITELGQYAKMPSQTLLPAAATSNSQYGMIELGYSATTLVPANTSVPTFTLGDELWLQSEFNASVSVLLVTPAGRVAANETVRENAATQVFSFTPSYDYDGIWGLNVSSPLLGTLYVPITFVEPLGHAMQASLSSYGFQSDQLALGFSLSSPGSYGVQGCLLPQSDYGFVNLSAPSSLGSNVQIENAGNGSVSFLTGGALSPFSQDARAPSQAFEVWIELYYSYSYQSTGLPSSFFSTYEEAALTNPVVLSSSNERASPALNTLVGMREGVFQLRVYFEVGGNLSVEQTNVLVQGPKLPWVWLGGCAITPLNGPLFVAASTLSTSSGTRPNALFLSYFFKGVELYLLDPLDVQLGEFTLFVSALEQVPTNIGIEVNVSSGAYRVIGESVFIASASSSVQANYSLTFGGVVFQRSPLSSYSLLGTQETDLNLGKMNVFVTFDGTGYPNATVSLLNNALGGKVTLRSGLQGNTTFFGPAGSYTLLVSVNGSTITRSVSLIEGQSSAEQVSLNATGGLSIGELEILLVGSAAVVVGVAANLWVWIFRNRRMMRK